MNHSIFSLVFLGLLIIACGALPNNHPQAESSTASKALLVLQTLNTKFNCTALEAELHALQSTLQGTLEREMM